MPRIPEQILDCVFYPYAEEESARKGTEFGGTGFLVGIPSRHAGLFFSYAVTNHHVACSGGSSVIRINTVNGEPDIFAFEPHDWHFDPRFDIAVRGIGLSENSHKYALIGPDSFTSQEQVHEKKIGVGDDVFMVGRFVDHDGGPINKPAARFGHISVMPSPIKQPNGQTADSYCIDLHSRSGYSGSPVFVYRTPGYDLEERLPKDLKDAKLLIAGTNYLGLLGIHFAQFPEQWQIGISPTALKPEASDVPLVIEGGYVKGLSGMTCVLPAWTIMEVLNSPRLVESRNQIDDEEDIRLQKEGKLHSLQG